MRILDLTTLYIDGGEGGVNTYLHEKARTLEARGDACHVLVVPGERDEQRALFGSTVHVIASRRLPSNPQHRVLTRFAEVQRIIRDERPDVVEVDCAYLLGKVAAQALAPRSVPVIGFYHVHLPTFIARPRVASLGGLVASTAERWTWRYVDYCSRACDRIVVSSRDMQGRLLGAGYPHLDLIPLGVNHELFRAAAGGPRGPDDPLRILYVGRLSREKDVDVLLDAFFRLRPREGYRLDVVGDGPVREELQARAGRDPRVRLLGGCPYGPELVRRYADADVLAVPSPNDTFNLTVLEGLAAGLPVVAMRQGGPAELLTDAVGALARPGDAADLARCLAEVGRRRIDPELCRAHVASQYSWERTFERLLEVYEAAIRTKRGAHSPAV